MGLSPGGLNADVSPLQEQFAACDKEPDYILPSPGEAVWLSDTICSKWNWPWSDRELTPWQGSPLTLGFTQDTACLGV